jgi:hypothetical protein
MYFLSHNLLFWESMTLCIDMLDIECVFCILCFVYMVSKHVKMPCASLNELKIEFFRLILYFYRI